MMTCWVTALRAKRTVSAANMSPPASTGTDRLLAFGGLARSVHAGKSEAARLDDQPFRIRPRDRGSFRGVGSIQQIQEHLAPRTIAECQQHEPRGAIQQRCTIARGIAHDREPEILLSDLNMPVMPGFELLSMVRRQFPAIQTIAMSGAYSGIDVPSGVDADAFYEKGRNLEALLQLFSTPPRISRPALAPLLLHEIATLQSKHSARNYLPRRLDESAGLSSIRRASEAGCRTSPLGHSSRHGLYCSDSPNRDA